MSGIAKNPTDQIISEPPTCGKFLGLWPKLSSTSATGFSILTFVLVIVLIIVIISLVASLPQFADKNSIIKGLGGTLAGVLVFIVVGAGLVSFAKLTEK